MNSIMVCKSIAFIILLQLMHERLYLQQLRGIEKD